MGELRRDYILDRYVIISTSRGKRPHELQPGKPVVQEGTCYFCPGNESLTPPEIGRVGDKNWKVRWFENKFPAFTPEGQPLPKTDNTFYTWAGSYGYHEVIVETPEHNKQLHTLSPEELELVLQAYNNRITAISKLPNIRYVNVFKNYGYQGGTSIVHSHSQAMATSILPLQVKEEVQARNKFVDCPHCKIADNEARSLRHCFSNNDFTAFAPYASRFNYEVWIFPRKHLTSLNDCNLKALADILRHVLEKIGKMQWAYNIVLHYAPAGSDLHLHLEILPRIAVWAGFELGTEITINSVPPEEAAAFYRGEL